MSCLRRTDRIVNNACRVCTLAARNNIHARSVEFAQVADLTGIILTKLDGTAKGGIAVAIQSELQIPVKYIGVGESIEDLQKYDADQFVDALFDAPRSRYSFCNKLPLPYKHR